MTESSAAPLPTRNVGTILLGSTIGFAVAATEVLRYTALWTTSLPDAPFKYPVLIILLILGLSGVALVGTRTHGAPYRCKPLCCGIAAASVIGSAARWLCLSGLLPASAVCSLLVGIGMEAPYLLMANNNLRHSRRFCPTKTLGGHIVPESTAAA